MMNELQKTNTIPKIRNLTFFQDINITCDANGVGNKGETRQGHWEVERNFEINNRSNIKNGDK